MSEMKAVYGTYRKSDATLLVGECPFDAGRRLNLDLVDVGGQLYEIKVIKKLDPYDFAMTLEPSSERRFIALWYNGAAGMHEVVEDLIRKDVD